MHLRLRMPALSSKAEEERISDCILYDRQICFEEAHGRGGREGEMNYLLPPPTWRWKLGRS